MHSFTLINDFAAAGYGIMNLKEKDIIKLHDANQVINGVKVVMGPGTGMGQGFLTKSPYAPFYEVHSTEGGHVEYCPRS